MRLDQRAPVGGELAQRRRLRPPRGDQRLAAGQAGQHALQQATQATGQVGGLEKVLRLAVDERNPTTYDRSSYGLWGVPL